MWCCVCVRERERATWGERVEEESVSLCLCNPYLCPVPVSLSLLGSDLVWSGLVWSDLDGSGSGSALLLHYCRPAAPTAPACSACACFGASWEDPGSTICNQD